MKPDVYAYLGYDEVEGGIATGGGAVKGDTLYGVDVRGKTDTSGNHPSVAHCLQAMDDARRASAFFASRPPSRNLGAVHVGPGQTLDIATAADEVVQMDSLVVDGGASNAMCDRYYGYGNAPAQLTFEGGPAVINIKGRLRIGNCAQVLMYDAIVNLPGKGPSIRIGRQAYVGGILAPDRSVFVQGAEDDDGTWVDNLWVAKAVFDGLTLIFPGNTRTFCVPPL